MTRPWVVHIRADVDIENVLTAVAAQTFVPYEVIVVDGGSTDRTAKIAASYPFVRLLAADPPVGNQRQAGLIAASGELVCFLDADTKPLPDFLESSIAEMTRRKLDIACPKFVPYPSSPSINAVFAFFNCVFWLTQGFLASGAGPGILVYRKLAVEAGGFRPEITYEDIEFIRRASRQGRYGIVGTRLPISDRRFRERGVARVTAQYLALSFFFSLGLFKAANVIKYSFNHDSPRESDG